MLRPACLSPNACYCLPASYLLLPVSYLLLPAVRPTCYCLPACYCLPGDIVLACYFACLPASTACYCLAVQGFILEGVSTSLEQ